MRTELLGKYFDKSGDDRVYANNLVENEHGFASFEIQGETVCIGSVYGDGPYWEEYFQNLAQLHGCKKLRIITRRDPRAWIRKYGGKLVGFVLEREV